MILHHIVFKGVMDMPVEVIPAIEMVFKARDRIVTENHIAAIIFHLKIVRDLDELLGKSAVAAAVMIAFDEKFLPVELLQNGNGNAGLAPEHIAQHIDDIAGRDHTVPAPGQFGVHFLHRGEGAVIERQTVGVAEVHIRDVKSLTNGLLLRHLEYPPSALSSRQKSA